jgi:alkylhydroperoxidase family enzyme
MSVALMSGQHQTEGAGRHRLPDVVVGEADLAAVRQAGYTDAQVIEIVQHVALNTWTNSVLNTERIPT